MSYATSTWIMLLGSVLNTSQLPNNVGRLGVPTWAAAFIVPTRWQMVLAKSRMSPDIEAPPGICKHSVSGVAVTRKFAHAVAAELAMMCPRCETPKLATPSKLTPASQDAFQEEHWGPFPGVLLPGREK